MEALARSESQADMAGVQEQGQYLTFTLAGETFAIGILNIKEIMEYGNITAVPMMPEFIRGVINVRGRVVPVIDLLARFGKQRSEITKKTCIVIIELATGVERHDIGVMVDAVNEVLEIPAREIESAPAFGAKIRTDFIEGMGKIGDRFVIILDVGHVLSVDEISLLAQAGQTATEASAVRH